MFRRGPANSPDFNKRLIVAGDRMGGGRFRRAAAPQHHSAKRRGRGRRRKQC